MAIPPPRMLIAQGRLQAFQGGRVERYGGLVQKPNRPGGGEQAGERELPFLSRREETGWQMSQEVLKPEGRERRGQTVAFLAEKVGPECEVLLDGQRSLDRV